MQEIKTDPEYKTLLPSLPEGSYKELEASLIADGCRDDLIIDENGVLVDGYNRIEICQRHGITFTTSERFFGSREATMSWMISTQIGRRNLSEDEIQYYRGKHYEFEKVREPRNQHTKSADGQNGHRQTTAQALGEQYGVGEHTIRRDAKFAQGVDKIAEVSPAAKQKILSGQAKIPKKEVQSIGSLDEAEVAEVAKRIESDTYEKPRSTPAPTKKQLDEVVRSIKDPEITAGKNITCDSRAAELANRISVFSNSLSSYAYGEYSVKGISAESKKKITAAISEMEAAMISIKKLL